MWLSLSMTGFPTEVLVCITSHLHPKTSGVLSLWSPVLQMRTVGQGVGEIAQSHHTCLHLILAKTQWRSRKADSKQHLLGHWASPGPFKQAACSQAALIVKQVFPLRTKGALRGCQKPRTVGASCQPWWVRALFRHHSLLCFELHFLEADQQWQPLAWEGPYGCSSSIQKILPSFCHSKAMHEKYLLLNLEVNYSCSSVPRTPWYLQQMGYKPQLSRVQQDSWTFLLKWPLLLNQR